MKWRNGFERLVLNCLFFGGVLLFWEPFPHLYSLRIELRLRYVMPSAHLTLREEDVVRLALEFLHNRDMHISQLSLERETGVINGSYSDDVLFLRQLILDGQWDDVLEFIQPLESLPAFDMKKFKYYVLRRKYEELLCIKSEATLLSSGGNNVDNAVEEVVKVLRELEKVVPSKDEYSHLCLLLTLPKLNDHLSYKDWNPSHARVQCFREILPIVEKFLPNDKKTSHDHGCTFSKNDRLIQLVIKGILYESCVNYCQSKATGIPDSKCQEINFTRILDGNVGLGDSDLSLISWLQCVPSETFSIPFEQRTLNVDVEKLDKPTLETSWTEHMLVTPIKPKTFPHSAMPFTRPRSAADVMSRSLLPAFEGLGQGLGPSRNGSPLLMALSTGELNPHNMSRSSFASFHLTGFKNNKLMNTSVDRLFENDNEEVFLSTTYADFQPTTSVVETSTPKQNPSSGRKQCKSPESKKSSNVSTTASSPDQRGRDSPSSTSRSSRRDSLSDRPIQPAPDHLVNGNGAGDVNRVADNYDGDLMKEFQKQKQKFQETLMAKGKQREELLKQIQDSSPRLPPDDCSRVAGELSSTKNVSPGVNNKTGPSAKVTVPGTPPVNGVSGGKNSNFDSGDDQYDLVKPAPLETENGSGRPRFVAVTTLEDVQAVRCAEFHPSGKVYAIGSNSKTLRICAYPKLTDLREEHSTYQPAVLFKRTRHHKGSIYCMAWTPNGDLMATGSNDKTVKLMKFNPETSNLEGQEIELSMHDGTVRDLCFLEDTSNKSSLLISGGAGDCKIYVTDCATGSPYQALGGHGGHVLSLYNWGGAMFVSGSQDKTVRFWDLRVRGCVNVVTPVTAPGNKGSPVAAVCVDPSGRLLVSGHEDSSCVLYDIRGARNVQCFKPHSSDIRSIRFSPSAYYLLTGGYDNKLVLTDLQGDLTLPLPSVVVAQHQDKVISGRWHPTEFSFLSTSADKTCTLWALPPV